MLELKIQIDNVDYMSVIKAIIPLVVKNKLMASAATVAANAKLKNMSHDEQEKYVSELLNGNKDKIKELLNQAVKNKGIQGEIKELDLLSL